MASESIGRFEILQILGQGPAGIVYQAYDQLHKRLTALRVLRPFAEIDEEVRPRLIHEVREAAGLSHPNIISIYEVGETQEQLYVSMEYVDGRILKDLIDNRRFIPFAQKLEIIIQICEGLGHAHEKGVIHRDVKPGHVLITEAGEVSLLDFGLARIGSSEMTRAGVLTGSPYYLSPEQVKRRRDIDARSDLFSVTVLLYELISYQRPFESAIPTAVSFQIVSEPHQPISLALPGCSDELSEILDRGLSKDKAARYQGASEFAAALSEFKGRLPDLEKALQEEVEEMEVAMEDSRVRFSDPLAEDLVEPTLFNCDALEFASAHVSEAGFPIDLNDYGILLLRRNDLHRKLKAVREREVEADRILQLYTEALEQLDAGELEACRENIEEILRHTPPNPKIKKLGELLKEREREQESQLRFEAAARIATLTLEKGEYERSLEAASLALKIRPDDAQVMELRDRATEGLRQDRLEDLIELAQVSERKGDWESCRKAVDEALQLDPDSATLKEIQQRSSEALKRAGRVTELVGEARRFLESDQHHDVLRLSEEILALEPEHRETLWMKDSVSQTLARLQKASELTLKARQLEEARDLDGCSQIVLEALELDPENPELLQIEQRVQDLIARQRMVESLLEEAQQCMESAHHYRAQELVIKVLELQPELPEALSLKRKLMEVLEHEKLRQLLAEARQYAQGGAHKACFELTNEALNSFPDNTDLKQLHEEAKAVLLEENERENQVAGLVELARKDMLREDYASALENLKFLIQLVPEHAEARSLKEQAEAAQQLEAAAAVTDSGPPASAAHPRTARDPGEEAADPAVFPGEAVRRIAALRFRSWRTVSLVGAAVLVLLLVGLPSSFESAPPESPVELPTGSLSLHVSPWANVESIIQLASGEEFSTNHRLSTPCRINLPAGKYRIRFRNPHIGEPLEIEVEIAPLQMVVVREKFPDFDPAQEIHSLLEQ